MVRLIYYFATKLRYVLKTSSAEIAGDWVFSDIADTLIIVIGCSQLQAWFWQIGIIKHLLAPLVSLWGFRPAWHPI